MTRIEIGITHEVVINGDKSWIRLSIADDYEPDVIDMDIEIKHLSQKVNQQLIKVIEQTVEAVEAYGK